MHGQKKREREREREREGSETVEADRPRDSRPLQSVDPSVRQVIKDQATEERILSDGRITSNGDLKRRNERQWDARYMYAAYIGRPINSCNRFFWLFRSNV